MTRDPANPAAAIEPDRVGIEPSKAVSLQVNPLDFAISGDVKTSKAVLPSHTRGGAAHIRQRMREGLEDLLPTLFDDMQAGRINKMQFVDFLAKYGIGSTGSVTIVSPDVIARLEKQAALIATRESWDSRELLLSLRDVWT